MTTNSELIAFLQTQPQDAILFFSLWQDDQTKLFHIKPSCSENHIYEGNSGEKFLEISFVDDCIADRLFRHNGKIHETNYY